MTREEVKAMMTRAEAVEQERQKIQLQRVHWIAALMIATEEEENEERK